ncbi:hypothetical protein MACH15_14960 [Maricaulis maris]|jgi:cytoskeletal protein CcmA (bactofilin family)|nr:hypothetical protein MACH15_14960 [Maricaulis maris]
MFNKGNNHSSPETGANSAPPKRNAMKSKAPSILSSDLVLTGTIVSDGEIQLDGTVDGDVRAGSLIIGEDATVSGEVQAETVVIRGRVTGSVRARQVQLASTARIEGDIVHAALSVESGAFFDGHCRHSSDPLKDTTPSQPAVAKDTGMKAEPMAKADSKPPAPAKGQDPLGSLEPPVASKSGF